MKAYMMFRDRDFDSQQELPWNEPDLAQDLELNTLFEAMARGDDFLLEIAKTSILQSLSDINTILYRQETLKDCLRNSQIVREIYDVAVKSIEAEKKAYFGIFSKYPEMILHRSVEVLQMFIGRLRELHGIAEQHTDSFQSEAFTRLFAMLNKELDDTYFGAIMEHLKRLKFRQGVLTSAELGPGNRGVNYVLRRPNAKRGNWLARLLDKGPPSYGFQIPPRDENGARALSELRGRGINSVANALARSTDHILSFFKMLRTELAFYVACLNLYEQLSQQGQATTFPAPAPAAERQHAFRGLVDVCLALSVQQKIVGNDLSADQKELMIVTGANQGGKSTFLRSIGLAQLMMQCGMFVAAESFGANMCEGICTHYKREEDVSMEHGKLDEELARMSKIVDHLQANGLLLFNESFAATNDREGSEISRHIVFALVESRIKIVAVTHLYDFAHSVYAKDMQGTLFLRAERQADGRRTFKMKEGEPLQTSYGKDLYDRIFGAVNYADERRHSVRAGSATAAGT